MAKNSITINKNDITKISTLVNMCPETFVYVPLKITKDDNGDSYASIQTLDVNASVVFGGKIKLDGIKEMSPGEQMVIRLPLFKQITNTIFNGDFDKLTVNSQKIIAEDDNRQLSILLYESGSEEANTSMVIPFTSEELLATMLDTLGLDSIDKTTLKFDAVKVKSMLDCMSILMNPETITFTADSGHFVMSSEDIVKNSVRYSLSDGIEDNFVSRFVIASDKVPISITKVMQRLIRYKDYDIDMLFCELLAAFTITGEDITVTIGIPAAQQQ